jgi:hypothetical protein
MGWPGRCWPWPATCPTGCWASSRPTGGWSISSASPDGAIAHPFVRNLVRAELLNAGYYSRSQRFCAQPDCQQIATLERARNEMVRWWECQQAADSRLCAALVAIGKRASIPSPAAAN